MHPNPEAPPPGPPAAATGRDGQEPETLPALLDLQTRFLYPFFFEPNAVKRASDALTAAALAGRADAWACAQPLEFYKEEVLDQVITFLFPAGAQVGCAYLRLSGEAMQTWFQKTEVELSSGVRLPVKLVAGPRIEVFLSNDGVGVLSLALTPDHPGLPPDQALDFNYQLAQCQPRSAQAIETPGPDLSKVPPAARDKVQPPPAPGDPLAERLTRPGGKFTLAELIGELLGPLRADEALGFREAQAMLSVYTVARFGADADLGRAEVRNRLAPFLSALAQIEEPSHAGATAVTVANAVLNRRHWAAVGQLGAAHLIADQPAPAGLKDHPYNPSRLPRVRDKYFIPYLMALLQRMVLHRSVATASTILKAKALQWSHDRARHRTDRFLPDLRALLRRLVPHRSAEPAGAVLKTGPRRWSDDLALLRENLLRFAVDGHFNQVSTREALHRYYRVAQQGLDAPTAWEEIRLAIAELHAWEAEARQRRLARNVSRNVKHIKEVQEFVHMIEYFLASVYFAHLWHMFAEGNPKVEGWHESVEHWAVRTLPNLPVLHLRDWVLWVLSFGVVSVGVVVFALLGFGVVWIINRLLGRHRRHKRHFPGPGPTQARGRERQAPVRR